MSATRQSEPCREGCRAAPAGRGGGSLENQTRGVGTDPTELHRTPLAKEASKTREATDELQQNNSHQHQHGGTQDGEREVGGQNTISPEPCTFSSG